ncbi:hypothetical protein Tco_0605984 [Tanacetum coccineum]
MCHIVGIEPQFKNIILNGPYVPMIAGVRKPEAQWTDDERNAANLDQRLKSLIMSVLPNDQMNFIINCETTISTWDHLILYHEGLSDVKESRVMDLKLCYNTFKFKEDSPDDEDDTRSSQEYMNDLEIEFHKRAILAKSKRFFKKGTQRFSGAKATDQSECHKCERKCHFARDCFSKTSVPSYSSPFQNNSQSKFISSSQQHKPELRPNKDFEAKYNKIKAKLALLSSGASTSKSSLVRNQGLFVNAYKWDEEAVSSGDIEMVEVKVLMALANDESAVVGKESVKNGEWVKIFMRKCISEHILNQKKRILGVDQLTEDPSSSRQEDLVFVKSSAEDTSVSIPNVERTWISEAEGFNLPNHDTVHSITDHNDIEWFRRGEALQAKKTKSLNAKRSKTPTKSGCSRHMTGVKRYLYKYVEQPGLKVVFEDNSTCTTKGYGSIKCNGTPTGSLVPNRSIHSIRAYPDE